VTSPTRQNAPSKIAGVRVLLVKSAGSDCLCEYGFFFFARSESSAGVVCGVAVAVHVVSAQRCHVMRKSIWGLRDSFGSRARRSNAAARTKHTQLDFAAKSGRASNQLLAGCYYFRALEDLG